MRLGLSIYQKLILMLLLLVLVPLVLSTFVSLAQARRTLVEQVGESRSYALVLAAERLESLANRLVSTAFFALQSDQLQEWIATIDEQNRRSELSARQRRERQHIFSSIDAFLENLSVNVIGAESYVTLLTPGGSQFANYDFIGNRPRRYIEKATADMRESPAPRIIWRGIEPNYVSPGDAAGREVLTLAMTLSRTDRGRREGLIIISTPSDVVRQVGRIPGPPGVIVLADHEHNGAVALVEPSVGTARRLAMAVPRDVPDGRVRLGGDLYYFARRPVFGETLSLIYAFNERNVAAELRAVGIRQMIAAGAISVVAIAVGFIFSRHLAIPLKELTRYANRFEPGSPPQSLITREDEIGTLQHAFVELHQRVRTLLHQQQENEAQKRKAELEALQAQIQPHFLFNTLNTIRWAAANGNTEKVTSTIIALASLLKITMTGEDALIPLSREFEVLKRYADIMQLRQGTVVHCTFVLDPKAREIPVPRLVLQPILENAILHGFRAGEEGLITVRADLKGVALTIDVTDNGCGISPLIAAADQPDTRRGFSRVGIANVRERLKLHYGEKATLQVERRAEAGTRARIVIRDTHEPIRLSAENQE